MNLKNPEFRKTFIDDVSAIIDTYVAAYKLSVENEEVFNSTANFAAELIPHTTNGYQRFLDEQKNADNKASVLAGFLINLTAQLKVTFGTPLLDELQGEIFRNGNLIQAPTDSMRNALSLWILAYSGNGKSEEFAPPSDYNALVTYLFLQRARWMLVKAKVLGDAKE